MSSALEALTSDQRERVEAAVLATFGSAPVQWLGALPGGATTARPLRIGVGGCSYLVRVEGTPSPLRNPSQYLAMQSAAAAGIAPRVHYVDEANRVAISDFIDQRPLHLFPGGPSGLVKALAQLIRTLQGQSTFPDFVQYPDIIGRLFAHVRRTGLFAPGILDQHTEHFERMREAYFAGPPTLLASHNDCIPSNILFDGTRLWLIDWESAYRNDRLVDVAVTFDTLARSPELQSLFFHEWLGREADPELWSRLDIVQSLTRLYYAGVFLSGSAAAEWRTAPESDVSAPSVAQFHQAIRSRQLIPGTPETKHILGKMFLSSFLSGALPPRFDAATAPPQNS